MIMSSKTTQKAGVIGVGAMGQHHVRVYDELADAEIVGIADADEERAAEIAAEYSTKVLDTGNLIDEVDVVSLAIPTAYHFDLARKCIEADVDVLVEKPLVEDPSQGRNLIRAAERAGVTLQVGHIERFNPAVETLGNIVPELNVIAIEAQRLGPAPDREIEDTVVMDLMIHDLDIVQWLVDAPVKGVNAVGTAEGRHATATLEFANGTVSSLTASRTTEQKVRKLSITAEGCYVSVDYLDQSIEIHRQSVPEFVANDGDVRYRHESIVENPAVDRGEPLKRELRSFLKTSRAGSEPTVGGEEGLRALELTREIDERAFGNKQSGEKIGMNPD